MISNLRAIIKSVAEANEIQLENYELEKLKLVEMHLNKSGDVSAAMAEVKHTLMGSKWSKCYDKIEDRLPTR